MFIKTDGLLHNGIQVLKGLCLRRVGELRELVHDPLYIIHRPYNDRCRLVENLLFVTGELSQQLPPDPLGRKDDGR